LRIIETETRLLIQGVLGPRPQRVRGDALAFLSALPYAISRNNPRPISIRLISDVHPPISQGLASRIAAGARGVDFFSGAKIRHVRLSTSVRFSLRDFGIARELGFKPTPEAEGRADYAFGGVVIDRRDAPERERRDAEGAAGEGKRE